MSESVLINAASVLAAAASAVEAYQIVTPPEVDFRVECSQAHSVRFYVANADFSAITGGAILPAYTATGVAATTGTNGTVYRIDAGSYDYVACVVTNDGAAPATVTVAVGYDLAAEAPTALFTVAEARAYDKAQLASATDYPSATIIAKEAEVRAFLTRICGVDFIPTAHADEYHDGDGGCALLLDWPKVTSITAASLRSGVTWTPLTADELAALHVAESGVLVSEGGHWPRGVGNVKVSYVAGHAAVPPEIKDAALRWCVGGLPTSNVPFAAESYDAGGIDVSYASGDGFNDAWHRDATVRRAIRLYTMRVPGIA